MAPSMAGNENKTNDDQRGVVFTLNVDTWANQYDLKTPRLTRSNQ